jgi:carboxyl-terminal processing protease
MKFARSGFLPSLWVALVLTVQAGAAEGDPLPAVLAQVFAEGHYSHRPLDAALSEKLLANYLDELDPDHLYFTQADIRRITADYRAALADEMVRGRTDAALAIFDFFKNRVRQRVDAGTALLKTGTFDFAGNRSVEVSREHAPWPAGEEEAAQLWRDKIAGEILDEKLGGASVGEISAEMAGEFAQMLRETDQMTAREKTRVALSALAHTYDPHSEYLTHDDLDDLESDMRLTMIGIGVVLEPKGRYVRIAGLMPGGPAAADGRLRVNDRIVAIAKGEGAFVDIAGLGFNRVIGMLRSKSGVKLRLKVVSEGSGVMAKRNTVELVCRKIELTDEGATAEVVEKAGAGGCITRLGWIRLPGFYGDPGHPGERSVTRDVRGLLRRLQARRVSGLVIDLRNNPGGELEEAVNTAGLFLGCVPVVQEKDGDGEIYVSKSENRRVYAGPLVVLVDHLTASAAELFAAALQDYGRAVVVGGHYPTFGKGSIQTIVDVGEVLGGAKKGNDLGSIQITIAKFYRINGQSTQRHGVVPDIPLPSPEDLPGAGESDLKDALEYDEVNPLDVVKKNRPPPLAALRERSVQRVASDIRFRDIALDLERTRQFLERNRMPLNEQALKAGVEEEKAREKEREAHEHSQASPFQRVALFAPAGLPTGRPAKSAGSSPRQESGTSAQATPGERGGRDKNRPDAIRDETLNILDDWVRQPGT